MLSKWQFNVLFIVGIVGLLALLFGPEFGLKIGENPTAVAGVGAIVTYILTQKQALIKHDDEKKDEKKEGPDNDVR